MTEIQVRMNFPEGYVNPNGENIEGNTTIRSIPQYLKDVAPTSTSNDSMSLIDRLKRKKSSSKNVPMDKMIVGHESPTFNTQSEMRKEFVDNGGQVSSEVIVKTEEKIEHAKEEDRRYKSRNVESPESRGKVPYIIDYDTVNISFIQTHLDLKALGVKNNTFFLRLYDRALQGVDPHSPYLDKYTKSRIVRECVRNPYYFLREVVRISEDGGGRVPFRLDRANLAATYLHFNNIDLYLTIPRQTGKTISILSALLWDFQFGTADSLFLFFNKDQSQSSENLLRLKVLRDNLPSWMTMVKVLLENGRIDKANSNVTSLRNPANNNRVKTKASANSVAAADNAARGDTSPLHYYDEVEFTPYIRTIIQAAGPSQSTASENAKKNGTAYGRIFTSTPGDLDSQAGEDAYLVLQNTCNWTETMYDMSIDSLRGYIAQNSKNGIVYIEYNYIQLGKDDKWLNQLCLKLEYDEIKIEREIHLKRMHGASNSAFSAKVIKRLMEFKKEPIREDYYKEYYRIDVYREIDKFKTYVMGVDTSNGTSGDSNAITLVDPDDYRPVLEFKTNEISAPEFGRVIQYILARYAPKTVVCIERNAGGSTLIDFLRETPIRSRLYYENSPNVVENTMVEAVDERNFVKRETIRRRYTGVNTNKSSRLAMMNILKTHMSSYINRFVTKNISTDIAGLIKTPAGKIQHRTGGHDDSVMSYLIALFVMYHGDNKEMFGIVAGMADVEISEEAKREQKEADYREAVAEFLENDQYFEGSMRYDQNTLDNKFNLDMRKSIQKTDQVMNNLPYINSKVEKSIVSSGYEDDEEFSSYSLGVGSYNSDSWIDELNGMTEENKEFDPYDFSNDGLF